MEDCNQSNLNQLILNLYISHLKTKKGKISKEQIIFEKKLGPHLKELAVSILNSTYTISSSSFFIVTHPKPREIFSAHYRDRVVHRLVVDQLNQVYDGSFYEKNFACRKGKGGVNAIKNLGKDVRKISKGGRLDLFYLQMDIESFFLSIKREILANLALAKIDKKKNYANISGNIFYDLVKKIFLHDSRLSINNYLREDQKSIIPKEKSWWNQPSDTGIPIGNLTSQFGANLYLNSLDHYITRKIRPESYQRYMDDLLVLSSSKESLINISNDVNKWLMDKRKLNLHPLKTKLGDLSEGMQYLGFECTYDQGHASCFRVKAIKRHYSKFNFILKNTDISFEPTRNHILSEQVFLKKTKSFVLGINSRLGFLGLGESYLFRKKMLLKFHRKKNLKYLILEKKFKKIKLKAL